MTGSNFENRAAAARPTQNHIEPYMNDEANQLMEVEYAFECPYCWQTITMLLDLSASGQEYVEDCEVCCRPILITYETSGDEVLDFVAQPSA